MVYTLLFTCLGFLSGSVLYSYHLPLWLKHVNVVDVSPDHNPGSVNAIKAVGLPLGLLCLALDLFKGCWPVLLASRALGVNSPLLCPILLAPVLGHALALAYPFRGGKAIAVSFGVLIGLIPLSWAATLLAFWYVVLSTALPVHPDEKRSVLAFSCFAATCLTLAATRAFGWWLALGCLLVACVPVYKNWTDWKRAPAPEKKVIVQKP